MSQEINPVQQQAQVREIFLAIPYRDQVYDFDLRDELLERDDTPLPDVTREIFLQLPWIRTWEGRRTSPEHHRAKSELELLFYQSYLTAEAQEMLLNEFSGIYSAGRTRRGRLSSTNEDWLRIVLDEDNDESPGIFDPIRAVELEEQLYRAVLPYVDSEYDSIGQAQTVDEKLAFIVRWRRALDEKKHITDGQ